MDDFIRRARRARWWFKLWLWMVPTAIVLLILLGVTSSFVDLRKYPSVFKPLMPVAPLSILAIIVGFAGILLMRGDNYSYRYSLAIVRFAERYGLSFLPKAEKGDAERIGRVLYPEANEHWGTNYCFGKVDGRLVETVELYSRIGYGNTAPTPMNKVVLLVGAVPRTLELCVRPRHWADAVNSLMPAALFDKPLAVPITPEFGAKCIVSGKSATNAEDATRLLTPEAAALCATNDRFTFVAQGGDLFVFTKLRLLEPGPPEALLQAALGFSTELGRTACS
jgi:hypothetical protein